MTFTQKLERLMEDRTRAKVSRRAGLHSNAIADYLNKGYMPQADNAFRLARALGVSLEWLLDDSQKWPPIYVSERRSTITEVAAESAA